MITEAMLLTVYLAGAGTTLVLGVGAVGYCLQRGGGWLEVYDTGDAAAATAFMAMVAVFWPAALVLLPFFVGRLIGKVVEQRAIRLREQRREEYKALARLRDTFSPEEREWTLLKQAMEEITW